MIKILLLVLVLFPNVIRANEVIYTDYILGLANSKIYMEEGEYTKRKENILYNTYTLDLKDEGYQEESDSNKDYYKDENDSKYEYYFTEESSGDDIYYIFCNEKHNYKVYELYVKDITQMTRIDDKISNIRIYNKDDLILNVNRVDTSQDRYHDYKYYMFNTYKLHDLMLEIEYNNDEKHDVLEQEMRYLGSNLYVERYFKIKKIKPRTVMRMIYLNNEDYESAKKYFSWGEVDSCLSGYLSKKTLYHYYSYQRKYTNNYTNKESSDYIIDYDKPLKLYDYYNRYYFELSDKLNPDNLDDVIVSTNADKDYIKLSLKENDNNYVLKVNYLDQDLYKVYEKEVKNDKKIVKKTSTTRRVVNIDREINTTSTTTTEKNEEIKNEKKYSYLYLLIPFTLSLLYIVFYRKKK